MNDAESADVNTEEAPVDTTSDNADEAPQAIVSEVDSDGIVVWEVTLHDAALYRATRVDWPWLRPQAR